MLVLLDGAVCRRTGLWPLAEQLQPSAPAPSPGAGTRTKGVEVRFASDAATPEVAWRTVFVVGRAAAAGPPGATRYHVRMQLRESPGGSELRAVVTDDGKPKSGGDGCPEARAPVYRHDDRGSLDARALELGLRLIRALIEGTVEPLPTSENVGGSAPWRDLEDAPRWIGFSRRLPRLVYGAAKAVPFALLLYLFRPVRDLVRTVARRHPVRIFTFHRVGCLCRDGMTVRPDVFRRQLSYLKRFHDIVALSDAVGALRSGRRLRRPIAVVTFDDGYASVCELAHPVLAEARLPACVFLSTELVGTTRRFPHDAQNPVRTYLPVMSTADAMALRRDGWELGAHTATHRRLADLTGGELVHEVEAPIPALRRLQGPGPVFMAYTFGGRADITPEAFEAVRRAGYAALCSNYGGENVPPSDLLQLHRIDLGGDHDPLAWRAFAHGLDLRGLARRARSLLAAPVGS